MKTKVKEYDGVIKTIFLGNNVPKENKHYTCFDCITIDSVMRMDKINYPQVYLEECKYKIKKTQIRRCINTELDLESHHNSDNGSDSNNDCDNDFDNDSDK